MTDTSKFRPEVSKLFEPGPPLQYVEQVDVEPSKRKTSYISGIAAYLNSFKEYQQTEFPESETTPEQEEQLNRLKQKKEKILLNKQKLDEDFLNWKPKEDPNIKGDPYKTVFVGRLDYDVTEVELQQEFSKYGDIERIRVVRDKTTNKSKGYAFILFERESGARTAYKEANGLKIKDRKILTDIERGRTVQTWLPRRLGGTVGGRHYTIKQKPKEIPSFSGRVTPLGSGRGGFGASRGGRGGLRFGSSRGDRSGGDRHFGGSDRGGRYGGYESSRGGYRGGDSGGFRGGYTDRYSSRGESSRVEDHGGFDSRPRYTSRSERPERSTPEYVSRDAPERTEKFEYRSRSVREDRDFNDRDRDHNREARVQSEREIERAKYREKKN